MLTLQTKIEGKTTNDLLLALDEMREKVSQGFTSGFDRNESSNYNFEITGTEETTPEEN